MLNQLDLPSLSIRYDENDVLLIISLISLRVLFFRVFVVITNDSPEAKKDVLIRCL